MPFLASAMKATNSLVLQSVETCLFTLICVGAFPSHDCRQLADGSNPISRLDCIETNVCHFRSKRRLARRSTIAWRYWPVSIGDTFAENSNTRTPLLASAELSNSERVVGIVVDYARQRPLNQSD